MVKIAIIGDYADFGAPVNMNEKQREKFVSFMQSMFGDSVETEEVEEITRGYGEREVEIKKWDVDDYCALFNPEDNETVARKTNRTEMSVRMRRGEFIPEFMIWLKKKGYALPPQRKHIKEFLEERGE